MCDLLVPHYWGGGAFYEPFRFELLRPQYWGLGGLFLSRLALLRD